MIYIREAHPTDGWQVPANEREKILVRQPTTAKERQKVAEDFLKQFKLTIPTLMDDIKNSTDLAYSGWPDRLYVVDAQGKVAYRGGPGPRGFQPSELPDVLDKLLKR